MFRQLTAIIMVVLTSFILFVNPVRAESVSSNFFKDNNDISDSNILSDDSDIWSDPFVESMIDSAKVTAGTAFGGVIVCYSIDGVATTVFPAAAALLPYCPAISAVGGGNIAMKEINPAQFIQKMHPEQIMKDAHIEKQLRKLYSEEFINNVNIEQIIKNINLRKFAINVTN